MKFINCIHSFVSNLCGNSIKTFCYVKLKTFRDMFIKCIMCFNVKKTTVLKINTVLVSLSYVCHMYVGINFVKKLRKQ